MATMNISLPDELKARMDNDGQHSNWSAVARKAFELELQSTRVSGGDMTAVIERLKASKRKTEEEDRPIWIEIGRKWVRDDAEYEELTRVTELVVNLRREPSGYPDADTLLEALCLAINDDGNPTIPELNELCEQLFGSDRTPSINQLHWFLDGVEEVWDEIADKL